MSAFTWCARGLPPPRHGRCCDHHGSGCLGRYRDVVGATSLLIHRCSCCLPQNDMRRLWFCRDLHRDNCNIPKVAAIHDQLFDSTTHYCQPCTLVRLCRNCYAHVTLRPGKHCWQHQQDLRAQALHFTLLEVTAAKRTFWLLWPRLP